MTSAFTLFIFDILKFNELSGFLVIPLLLTTTSFAIYLDEKNKIKNIFEKKQYKKIVYHDNFKSFFYNKSMSLSEIKEFFKMIKEESILSEEEVSMIIRNTENEENLEIGNEYFMLKIMADIKEQSEKKDVFNVNEKIKNQIMAIKKEKVMS